MKLSKREKVLLVILFIVVFASCLYSGKLSRRQITITHYIENLPIDDNGDTSFTLANTPSQNNAVKLFINGQAAEQGTGKDFTVSGKTVTWLDRNFTLKVEDIIIAMYEGYTTASDATYTETFYCRVSGDGSAPETKAGAWDMDDVNTSGNWDTDDSDDGKLGPNDRLIVLDDDGIFRKALTYQQSGLSAKQITIEGEYGGTPTLNCSDLVATWSQYAATAIYSASVNWTTGHVFEDIITELTEITWDTNIATTAAAMSAGTFSLDDANDLLYVWATDGADPDTHIMDVSNRAFSVNLNNKNYITFRGITCQYSNTSSLIRNYDSSGAARANVIISGCIFNFADASWIWISLDNAAATMVGLEVFDNTGNTAGDYGLYFTGNGAEYTDSEYYRNYLTKAQKEACRLDGDNDGLYTQNKMIQNGIADSASMMMGGTNSGTQITLNYSDKVVSGNTSAENFWIGGTSTGIDLKYNICLNATRSAALHFESNIDDSSLIGNSVFNAKQGVSYGEAGQCTGLTMQNNAFDEIGVDGNFASANASTYTAIDYNLWDENRSFDDNGTGRTFSEWQGQGYDVNGFYEDPLYVDPTNGDLSLQATSPCIDSGTDLGDPDTYALDDTSVWPLVIVKNQDDRGTGWEIGAFIYNEKGFIRGEQTSLDSFSKLQTQISDKTLINEEDQINFDIFPITPSAAPDADYEVSNKKYVDDNAGGSTEVNLELMPQQGKLPSSDPARIDAANNGWRLLFDDTTQQTAVWEKALDDDYGGGTLYCDIYFSMLSGESDEVQFEVYIMAYTPGTDSADWDTDSYDTENVGVTTVAATAGRLYKQTITLTNKDSAAAGDMLRIKISTDSDDAGNDDATGDRELRYAIIRE